MSRQNHRALWLGGCVVVLVGVVVGLISITASSSPNNIIPLFKGPPKGVLPADYNGAPPGNPNDIPSRVVILSARQGGLGPATAPNPAVSATQALGLAWQQLGPAAKPTSATATLGTSVDGREVWGVTYTGICIGRPFGQLLLSPSPTVPLDPSDPSCTLSIELDATTGDFIVGS